MTKSTSRRVRCMSCNETYNARKDHVCKTLIERGTNQSEPQKTKSNKLVFGKGKYR